MFMKSDVCNNFYKQIHIVNEIITPNVHYKTWQEFVDIVYFVRDSFCVLVQQDVTEELKTKYLSRVTGRELYKRPTLATTTIAGAKIIQNLTKNSSENSSTLWCEMVSHFLCTRALRAAFMFDDLYFLAAGEDVQTEAARTELIINCMQNEIRQTFAGSLPLSMYTLSSGFISSLLVKNFTFFSPMPQFIEDDDGVLSNHYAGKYTVFTNTEYQDMLLTLCMGQHPRLGQNSTLLPLTADILRTLCENLAASELQKHIFFHTQEEWLC
jgi:hypothetical protein